MVTEFVGRALPLDQDALEAAFDLAGIGAPELWAVLEVETAGCGFLASRRPAILFERHVFSRETERRYDASHPEVSNPASGGYGATGEHQYQRLAEALALDRGAALRSASWGIGQVMGFHAESLGYRDVEDLVATMLDSEGEQLQAMVRFLQLNQLAGALRRHDWPTFARGYNGVGYAANRYDTRLAAAYGRFLHGGLPDLRIRAAQLYLLYLGYPCGRIDGVMGKLTRSAMNAFQVESDLAATETLDEATFAELRDAALPAPDGAAHPVH